MSNSLLQLYHKHNEKRSDKWELYLNVYDRLLDPVRDEIHNIFEIGIQNGGSLEIWNKYFPNVNSIIGCDINPKCAELTYQDKNIKVLVEDANQTETVIAIKEYFNQGLDLIIDDGSHTSKDIISSFLNYFPLLNYNRFMIIEDLHCSYWKDFGGGLYDPMSSLAFLKKLADCINYEHWGIESKSKKDFLNEFEKFYEIDIDEYLLNDIHSVTFYNSICVIAKKPAQHNLLGPRIMAGTKQDVISLDSVLLHSHAPDQSDNFWTNIHRSPESLYPELLEKNYSYLKKIEEVKNVNQDIEQDNRKLVASNIELKKELDTAINELKTVKSSFAYRLINKLKFFSENKK